MDLPEIVMQFSEEMARHFTEDKIAFVRRMGLKAVTLEPGHVKLLVPLAGNENHIGTMYAGALFTLAEIPGGALFITSFDTRRFYPIIKDMSLRFRRPAKGDISVEARIGAEEIERIQAEASANGKADYLLELDLVDATGEVVAQSRGLYQLRAH
ncbi:hypothetical protein TUM18999_55780 [Pseudomonas tohonis]|uniref:Thioesterase n=2 Tax=Pseudomonas tohonis TaxID=2725477 RepID=A0A6J4EC82_9PSED|nr:hypothetical protein TUM18999_55780 [Pseudomonas tohonis]